MVEPGGVFQRSVAYDIIGMVKHISDNQDVQLELRKALRAAFAAAASESRQPSINEITKTAIPYLDAVIEETLRVTPPFRLCSRSSAVDTTVFGQRVPKGTTIVMPFTGPGFHTPVIPFGNTTQSDPTGTKTSSGEDMSLFKPERWIKINAQGDAAFDSQAAPFLSFGAGPRGCFGKRLAYLELRMVLVFLVWNFEFKQLQGELSSYDFIEKVATVPKSCFVSLEAL
jgi:cytochrome P450